MKRLMSLAAFGLGYVLGARAGRERYDQLMRGMRRVRDDPRVQEQTHNVAEAARQQAPVVMEKVSDLAEAAKEQAPVVRDKVSDVAASAVRKVHPDSGDTTDREEATPFTEEPTRFGEETPRPEGLLPTSSS